MELELAPFDVRECVEAVVDLIGPIAQRKGLEITYGIEPGTPETAVGDASRLRQILLNLLNNAVKFTDEGEIAVHVEAAERPSADRIAFHVAIRDTGIGIPPDRIDRLFQSFTQVDASTSRRFGGTGLGLAISRRLAELMGGTVTAESSGVPGQGSTFHVTFEAGVTDMTPTALRRDGSYAGRRALIVDDNATNLLLMTALLSAWGVETTTASSGDEALAAIEHGGFDVAIVDMLMPGMDGLELATRVARARARAAHDPRVVGPAARRGERSPVGGRRHRRGHRQADQGLGPPRRPRDRPGPAGGRRGDARRSRRAPRSPSSRNGIPLRILVAEDNVVNQRLALRLLEKLGYRADVAANGLEALEAVDRQRYDLVLMDVQMPEMDGVEATRRILERWTDGERPWIVAMTAEVMRGDREGFLAAGMNDYVAKPIRPQELVAAITRTPSPGRVDGAAGRGDGTAGRRRVGPRAARREHGRRRRLRGRADRAVRDGLAGAREGGASRRSRRATPTRSAGRPTRSSRTPRRSARTSSPIAAAGSRPPRRTARSMTGWRGSRPSTTSSSGCTPRSARARRRRLRDAPRLDGSGGAPGLVAARRDLAQHLSANALRGRRRALPGSSPPNIYRPARGRARGAPSRWTGALGGSPRGARARAPSSTSP